MSSNDVKTGTAPADWTRKTMKGLPAGLDALWTRKQDSGGWRYAVQLDESHCNAQGVVHGGVLMTFMDHALSLMIWEAADRALCSTIHLDSHFLSAVKAPAFVELDGEILRQGSKRCFARGRLRVEGKAVMEASGVWSVVSGKK